MSNSEGLQDRTCFDQRRPDRFAGSGDFLRAACFSLWCPRHSELYGGV